MSKTRLMFRLARSHFLILGFLLFLMGYLLALFYGAEPDLSRFIFGYFVFGLAHLSVSFSNDYFDRFSDRNSDRTVFSGGSRVLVENPELERLALKIAVFLIAVSVVGLAIFTLVYGYSWWFFLFGLLGGLTGWFYTAPPLKFSYRGLGELVAMFAIGFLMPGMGYFVASGGLSLSFLFMVFPVSCYGVFFIVTVELPDLESDVEGNKITLVVRWGRLKAKVVSVVATLLGTASLATISLLGLIKEVDFNLIILFSFAPLAAAVFSLMLGSEERKSVVAQVNVNMFSMVLFAVGMNGILLSQL